MSAKSNDCCNSFDNLLRPLRFNKSCTDFRGVVLRVGFLFCFLNTVFFFFFVMYPFPQFCVSFFQIIYSSSFAIFLQILSLQWRFLFREESTLLGNFILTTRGLRGSTETL